MVTIIVFNCGVLRRFELSPLFVMAWLFMTSML